MTAAQAECITCTERLIAFEGQGFRAPRRADPDKSEQNYAEYTLRHRQGLCLKCTQADVTAESFRSLAIELR